MMFLDDTRFAFRQLRRTPVFALTAILILGLGLGLNTMLFTLFNAYVLRTAAVQNPHSLYELGFSTQKGSKTTRFSWDQYQSIRSSSVFSDIIAAHQFYARLEEKNIEGQAVSGNYFTMLGVRMALGRFILPEDAPAPGGQPVAVLSNLTWKSQFGSDPGILGRKILINGHPFAVIGVCAAEFTGIGIDTPEGFYIPATMAKQVLPGSDPFGPDQPALFTVVGRLAGGIPVDSARAAMTLAVRRASEQLPEGDRAAEAILTSRATMLPLSPRLLAVFSPLIVAFLLILIVCCANVANMMLARAIARQREIGVRLALGADRKRLVWQLLSEGFLLAGLSGAMASAVAFFSLRGAQRLLLSTLPAAYASLVSLVPLHLDRNVLAFLVLAAGFVTVATSLAPALQATRLSLTDAMRGQFSAVLRPSRLRYALVVSQITICLVLLVVTVVLMRSSASFQNTHPGFETRGIAYPIFFGRGKDDVNSRLVQYLATQPWVDSIAAAVRPPLGGTVHMISISLPGRYQTERTGVNLVSAEYFGMLGIPILSGRNFAVSETEGEAPVAIVSQATARRLWPAQDAIGQTIEVEAVVRGSTVDQPKAGSAVVVGIAKDVVSGLVMDGPDATMIYFPTSIKAKRGPMLMVRTRLDTLAARQSLETALKAAWPDRPSIAVAMEDGFAMQVYPFLGASWIGFILGLIALALTVSGMYGVMSYLVSTRTKEIGIRMSLGASPGNVVGLILRQSGVLAGLGIGAGLLISLVIGKLLTSVFYMIRPFDAIAYGAGIGVVAVAAIASAFIPSRRASRIDPVETLRAE
jgi:predicted permease